VGLLGIGIAWALIFAYLSVTAQAMAIAEFFIVLLAETLSGMGWLVTVISVLLGALLGGFGGLFGRSLVEIIDALSPDDETAMSPIEPAEETAVEE